MPQRIECNHELFKLYPFGKPIIMCGKHCGAEFTEQDWQDSVKKDVKKRYNELREKGGLHIATVNQIVAESRLKYAEVIEMIGGQA